MNSLYEKIDSLKDFTTLKEVVKKVDDPLVTNISLYYGIDNSVEINLCEAVKGFNKFNDIGYLVADIEPFILDEPYLGFFTAENEVKVITIHLSDGNKTEYGITWCSPFNKIADGMHIMLFETKKGGYYKENSKF